MVKPSRHGGTRDLVCRADVAAVGFAVSPPGIQTLRVTIVRQRNGEWRVVDDSDLRGMTSRLRRRAISMSAAVICGANLFGTLVTEVKVDDEVRWVRVTRAEARGTDPS